MCWTASLKYQTGKSLKWANRLSSDFLLLSSVSVTVRQASMIAAEAITTKNREKYHKSPGIALTTYRSQRTRTGR